MFLIFSILFHKKKEKETIIGHFLTFHIQVTWYKHTYFCSKMAIRIGITKPVSKPKNGAKNGYFTSN